jgi:WhiB family transcriptional regulator, redox-sensing transcriptional regulator
MEPEPPALLAMETAGSATTPELEPSDAERIQGKKGQGSRAKKEANAGERQEEGWVSEDDEFAMILAASAKHMVPPGRSRDSWQSQGLCISADPELFFQQGELAERLPKRICRACPVRSECLEFALTHPKIAAFGVWGGMSERERRKMIRRAF